MEVSEIASLITPVPGGVGTAGHYYADGADLPTFKRVLNHEICFWFGWETLSFDYMTIDEEIKQVLLTAPQFGHEVLFASARSLSRLSGTIGCGIE